MQNIEMQLLELVNKKMNKIASEKQKKEVRGYIIKWRRILFLEQWDFLTEFHKEEEGLRIVMKTEYKDAIISINAEEFFKLEKFKREEMIVHELCHCITQPLIYLIDKAASGMQVTEEEMNWFKENATQHIARAIFYKNL